MKTPIYSESHNRVIQALNEKGITNYHGGIQLFTDQFDSTYSISINFNGTGIHIGKDLINPVELEGDELIRVCKTWTHRE